nr:unnamed protein product [Callosobruchus analis]
MAIPPQIINPYGDIEEWNGIIQEELNHISTVKKRIPAFVGAKKPTRYLFHRHT